MLKATNLKKTYEVTRNKGLFHRSKVKIEAVKDISLQIEKGHIVGLLGVNGAGKTTTIKMLTTLLEPSGGSYQLDEIDGIKNPNEIKKRVNMIAGGERMIYWRLSARENLMYYGSLYGVEKNELKKRAEELLDMVQLTERADDPVETYSKGMKQRLQIARGLINHPEYIFMDEPTIGLDAMITQELHGQIKELAKKKEKGILLTSHYLNEVEELCDYIYILSNGRLIKQGTVKELSSSVFKKHEFALEIKEREGFLQLLSQKIRGVDAEAEISGEAGSFQIRSVKNLIPFLADLILKEGITVKRLQEIEPSLEDTILQLSEMEQKRRAE